MAPRPSTSRRCSERISRRIVVFNLTMRLRLLIAAATLAVAVGAAAPASAKIIEVGRTDAAPACPATPCLAVSQTTGYQIKVGDSRGDFTVPRDGLLVAWSITLGTPTKKQIDFFNKGLGGQASAGITLLRPGRHVYSRVMATGPIQPLQPY